MFINDEFFSNNLVKIYLVNNFVRYYTIYIESVFVYFKMENICGVRAWVIYLVAGRGRQLFVEILLYQGLLF